MSMKLMVQIMEEADLSRPHQAVLLAMAENAWDDGSHCYPSIDKIAWKAGYKTRNVIDIIRELRQMGVLEVVDPPRGRRATRYHIHVAKAPRKLTFEEWQEASGRHADNPRRGAISRDVQNDLGCNLTSLGVQNGELGVQSHVQNSRENAPEPLSEPLEPLEPTTHVGETTNVVQLAAPPDKPARKGKRPEHGPAQQIMAVFCDVTGIERFPDYEVAGGMAKNLIKAGVTAEDIPDMVAWCFEQTWIKGGIDLGTLYRNVVRWRTDRLSKHRRNPDDANINPDTGKPYAYNDARSRKVFVG